VLLVALFASSAYLWRGWNPTVPKERFYARTQTLDDVQKVIGNEQALRLGTSAIPPDLNLAYRIRSPENYDALGVRDYDALVRRLLHAPTVVFDGTQFGILAGPYRPESTAGLRVLGIRYVTTGAVYPFAVRSLNGRPAPPAAIGETTLRFDPIAGGARQVSQLVLRSRGLAEGDLCRITVLRDGRPVAPTVQRACTSPGIAVALPRPVAVEDGLTVRVVVSDEAGAAPSRSVAIEGTLVDTQTPGLVLVTVVDGISIYRVPGAAPRVFSPARTVMNRSSRVVSDERAQPLVLSNIDTQRGGTTSGRLGQVRVTRDEPGDIRFEVTRTEPGWAIVMETAYPGWKATVDGRTVDIERANGAFMAVPVPAGTTTVHLSFEPGSFKLGLLVTTLSVVALILLVALAIRGGRSPASTHAH
jgi:hypothetical protein